MTPDRTTDFDGVLTGELLGSRVLKCHVEAARQAITGLLRDRGPQDTEVSLRAAQNVAGAVLSATDGSQRPDYVIVLRIDSGRLILLGRYRSFQAARKAIERGLPMSGRAGILPVIPYPTPRAATPTRQRNRRSA